MATDIIYPADLPRFLASGHSRGIISAVRRSDMEMGTTRVRRCFSFPPQMAGVSTELTQEQLDILHDFFENTLEVGSLSFYVEIAGFSPENSGLEIYEAMFLAPPVGTIQHGTHRYMVEAELLLIGDPYYIP